METPAQFVSFGALHAALTKTEWYDGAALPVRSGVYEVESLTRSALFRYFDGERWYYGGVSPAEALYAFQTMGLALSDCPRWRGLTEPHK